MVGDLGLTANMSTLSAYGNWNVVAGSENPTDTILRLNYPVTSSTYASTSEGFKRKRADNNSMKDSQSNLLVLGLGPSPSSSNNSKESSITASTMSSVRESDEGSSRYQDLNLNIHPGNDNAENTTNFANAAPKIGEAVPVFDLQLNLSTGPSTSAITSLSPVSSQQHNSVDTSAEISPSQTTDDGSTSSLLETRSCVVPSSYVPERIQKFALDLNFPAKADPLPATPDLNLTIASTMKSPVACTSGLTNGLQRSTSTKSCQFPGCEKGARGASGLCIAHGGGRRCQKVGCHKGAEGKTIYCKAHGGGRRCQFLGCTKSAEGRTDYCIAHGGGRRCSHEGCTKAARGKSGLCIRHGGGKRCQMENCTKSAEGHSGLCISHGGGRRCQYPECNKGAQGSTKYCKAHGGGKRCTIPGCTKGAEGSTPFCKGHGGGKRCSFEGGGVCPKSVHGGTQFCVAHGGGKRCAVLDCTKSARGRTNFCVRHGGGKRCKADGCGKSAQGSTDFCKAHGGGRRCSWGQAGSGFGAGGLPCDRFGRGKSGLCAAHSAMVQDHCVHGRGTIFPPSVEYLTPIKSDRMEDIVAGRSTFSKTEFSGDSCSVWGTIKPKMFVPAEMPLQSMSSPPPEERVHGGSLMVMLAGNALVGSPLAELGLQYSMADDHA